MNYDRIYPCDFVNGPGCRTVLFVTGCLHKCEGCYNKSTWNARNGIQFTGETLELLIECLNNDYIEGLTITGGDPLYPDNRDVIHSVVQTIKNLYPNKSIWLWTGYKFEDIKQLEMLKYVDVIIDGKYEKNLPTKKLWRGSDNQRLWSNTDGVWKHD